MRLRCCSNRLRVNDSLSTDQHKAWLCFMSVFFYVSESESWQFAVFICFVKLNISEESNPRHCSTSQNKRSSWKRRWVRTEKCHSDWSRGIYVWHLPDVCFTNEVRCARPKKQRRMVAVILWNLTGKRKVAGRYFGETSFNWGANEAITNRQKDRGIMILRDHRNV